MTLNHEKVEQIAREMCRALGHNPDEPVPVNGYKGAPIVPRWHHEREWAIRHLSAHQALARTEGA